MRKELGKLLLDIVKYVVTAVIVSDIFTEVEGLELYITASITTTILLIFGLLLVKDPKEEKTQKNKPKKRK
ncbi:DUF6722 family protein [Capnocytophaga felis]|uniref:Uncharacterized protein n=1 Tax=Capnocytophaga felis TaxID=2267611 RepID=A0A5M4B6Q0_9FLAO|nr:DUF6722 family protein [Capnocytophaga felis]GET45198.1 hypothetical protein RCZ01_05000 [Capnocytophaga felis]GET47638.1 hypothetical protein RCZ02_04690 [Capnocytophaga felis]